MAKYFDLEAALKKAVRRYERGEIHRAWMQGESIFPLRIPFPKVGEKEIKGDYGTVAKEVGEVERSGLPCEYKSFRFARIGVQRLPIALLFRDLDSYLEAISKKERFERFRRDYTLLSRHFPSLLPLLLEKPLLIEREEGKWERLIAICDYFLSHPRPGRYLRELAIENVDSKFIEKNKKTLDTLLSFLLDEKDFDPSITAFSNYGFERKYGLKYPLPLIRFRLLDEALHRCGMSDITLPQDEFEALSMSIRRIFIIENKTTFLSMPRHKDSIAIFGSGYGVGSLENAQWIRNAEIFYWGDIDTHGFAILSQFRACFDNVQSLMMDRQTLQEHLSLCVEEPPQSRFEGDLRHLNEEEKSLFDALKNDRYGKRLRLEQERIGFGYVLDRLMNL